MTREGQIKLAAFERNCDSDFDSNGGLNGFVEGAQWADETMLQEVIKWLDENFYDVSCLHDDRLEGDFPDKEHMIQSFKERFNI